jgi:hypothetical protein
MRTKQLVKIVATDAVRKLAQKAMDIQDACNPRGVQNFLKEVMDHFASGGNGQSMHGSDICVQNPVSLAVLNKLNDLAGLDQSKTTCFMVCMDLADGIDCDVEVALLR